MDIGMKRYDFSNILNGKKEYLLQTFLDRNAMCINIEEDEINHMKHYYEQIFDLLVKPFELELILDLFKELAQMKISSEIPYVIISNEVYVLESLLIMEISDNATNDEILEMIKLFKFIANTIAFLYLKNYIEKLISLNNVRRNSLVDLVEKHLISHYESHLVWLSTLAQHIKDAQSVPSPQLDHHSCEFGKWLESDGKLIMQNNSKYKAIDRLHKNLHLFAKKILSVLGRDNEHHILITYLEKCELISLSIGTELALLDQIAINNKVAKDSLTGALNRNALENVFESQYEIAFATDNSFVVAMCDLDHFKSINDTYGHLAGDEVLKKFVEVVKNNIRSSDLIIRYGGEEFIIILSAIDETKGYAVLDKLRENFAKLSVQYKDKTIKTSVSIGMAEIKPYKYYKKKYDEPVSSEYRSRAL